MATIINTVVFSFNGAGTWYETTRRLQSSRRLTAKQAQAILRRETGDKSIVVSRVEAIAHS